MPKHHERELQGQRVEDENMKRKEEWSQGRVDENHVEWGKLKTSKEKNFGFTHVPPSVSYCREDEVVKSHSDGTYLYLRTCV